MKKAGERKATGFFNALTNAAARSQKRNNERPE
jgi:hypothetical protein